MREQTVAMRCFLDDLLTRTRPVWARPTDPRRRLSGAEVLTTALVAARYFGGNPALGRRYRERHWGLKALDKSGFTRHLHRLSNTLPGLFATFGQALQALPTEARYVIDSFPVAVCQNTRTNRSKLLGPEACRGRNARKRRWFYGFQVQIVATADGVPVDFYVHADADADLSGLRHRAPDLPAGGVRYPGAGYTDHGWEGLFADATGHRRQTARKGNSTRPQAPHETFLPQHFRKTIETAFRQLTARFPKQIHAVTAQGVVLKIVLFIFVHSLDQVGL